MGIQSRSLANANGYAATIAAISASNSIQGGNALPGADSISGTGMIKYDIGMFARNGLTATVPHPGLRVSQEEVLLMASLAEELRSSRPAGTRQASSGLKTAVTEH